MKSKQVIIDVLQDELSRCEDDAIRQQMQCRRMTPEQLNSRPSGEGLTNQEMLNRGILRVAEIKQAIEWMKSQP